MGIQSSQPLADCGLGIGDFGLRMSFSNSKSPIRNPKCRLLTGQGRLRALKCFVRCLILERADVDYSPKFRDTCKWVKYGSHYRFTDHGCAGGRDRGLLCLSLRHSGAQEADSNVELAFLFPWSVVFRDLGWFGFVEMLVFFVIVGVGFVYAWKIGALEWE